MLSSDEIEREFRLEVKSKKLAASGVHHKTGKRGYTGTIIFPSSLLRGKEKREYTKPGKVRQYNMFTSLTDYETLISYSPERQKDILIKWREQFPSKEIIGALGINRTSYYELLYKHGILERPSSSKEYKDGLKRDKLEAKPEDIMNFQDLKLLTKEKQLQILDDYNERFNMPTVAKIWGKDVKSVYSLRYTLKKSLEKAKKKEAKVKESVDEHKQMDLITGIEPKKEEISGENETLTSAETEEELTDTQKELEKLKLIVEQQAQLLRSFIESQQTAEYVATAVEPVQESVPAFTMKFEKENEGFILHQDLKRFITVLEKNPDIFKVEVKITRIEEI
ncbi:hypothetical protein [Bacillus sp. EB600]|uniref:hypothetical protein n=1 Tax=Bacillus sp. EB600 TaxID=2806345 RepID=UPI00210A712B|nr:hypothetical protein [Bacillus sp. EB600]MCQ6281224.1 hypothetical protein [Bacillus sp. EB600]